jgi:N-acetylglucosamine-6-sulfatase
MLYVSHKAVHSDFVAADRHKGKYKNTQMPLPVTYENSKEHYEYKPMWLRNQRNSRHGVDFAYNLQDFDLNAYYQRYTETLLAVDENVGKLLDHLEKNKQLDNTLFIYMGDNGFQFGEHGLIDKRTAYTASVKVPLLIRYPKLAKPHTVVKEMVANIDIAPTLLQVAGLEVPSDMDGRSFLPVLNGNEQNWRKEILYEYYWESNYPYTPTTFALITDRYKYIQYYGIWDINELYDLQNDPDETKNLIYNPAYVTIAHDLKARLAEKIRQTGGNKIPMLEERGKKFPWRKEDAAEQAPFPDQFYNVKD